MQLPGFDADEVMREAVRRMTVQRKLQVAHALRELAWEIKASVTRSQHPDLSEEEVQARVRDVFRHALR